MNRTELVDVSAYHKISLGDNGVNYAMKVIREEDGVYKCEGYALAHGVQVAEWVYWANSLEEATSQHTKDYLYREMKPMVLGALRELYRVAVQNGVDNV